MRLRHYVLYTNQDTGDLELVMQRAEIDYLVDAQIWPRSDWANKWRINCQRDADYWANVNRYTRLDVIYSADGIDQMRSFYMRPLTQEALSKKVLGCLEEVVYDG